MQLFKVPPAAVPAAAEPPFPLGGLGGGHFVWDDRGEFRGWRLQPGVPEVDAVLAGSRFHVWFRTLDKACCAPLVGDAVAESRRLFPITWRRYEIENYQTGLTPPVVESASFSPLLPEPGYERSLPIHVVSFRAHNPTRKPVEVALLLNWTCGSPDLWRDVVYDFQHDNLCLTGSVGPDNESNRQGISVPDLHYIGAYEQGVHPWFWEGAAVSDFAHLGELAEPKAHDGDEIPAGAGAWLKFALRPGETKEAPFVLAWHLPLYEAGPAAGFPRYYTQFLGRRRPDNAIVWLAEQAVQHFGAETANYRYWYQAIRDWQDLAGPGGEINGLAELLRADVSWTEERGLELGEISNEARARLRAARIQDIWPDFAQIAL